MFLKNLTLTDEEKYSFMVIVHKIIASDGVEDSTEKDLLESFVSELGIHMDNEIKNIQNPVALLAKSSNVKKRSMYIELLSLAFIDGNYDSKEENELMMIQQSFGLPDDFVNDAKIWLAKYMDCVEGGFQLVGVST